MHKYSHSTSVVFFFFPACLVCFLYCVRMYLCIYVHRYIVFFHFIFSRKDSYASFPKEIADKLHWSELDFGIYAGDRASSCFLLLVTVCHSADTKKKSKNQSTQSSESQLL